MGLNVGNSPVKQVYVGSTPVTAVYVGAKKVWPIGPRKVTITKTSIGHWDRVGTTGDTSLIQEWVGSDGVRFHADVTCDQAVYRSDSHLAQNPGTTLRAGAVIKPYRDTTYTFTEII